MNDRYKLLALFAIVIVFGGVSIVIVAPFLSFVIVGLLLAFLLHPLYLRLHKRLGDVLAAFACILVVLGIVVLPGLWLASSLIQQTTKAYQAAQANGFSLASLAAYLPGVSASDLQLSLFGPNSIFGMSRVAALIPWLLAETGTALIGLIIFLMVMFYGLKDGHHWFDAIMRIIPIRRDYKTRLKADIEQMTQMLFYGQALDAILIGTLSGVVFEIFRVPTPVLWGFTMMIFTFLPVFGAPIIYVPAGLLLASGGRVASGVAVIALCSFVMIVADYVVKPRFISHASALHPLTVIVGAIGGVYALGFVGFLIGPLILGIFVTLLGFDFGTE